MSRQKGCRHLCQFRQKSIGFRGKSKNHKNFNFFNTARSVRYMLISYCFCGSSTHLWCVCHISVTTSPINDRKYWKNDRKSFCFHKMSIIIVQYDHISSKIGVGKSYLFFCGKKKNFRYRKSLEELVHETYICPRILMWVAFGTTLKILGTGFFFVCTCDICAILENWCREKLPSQRPPICGISETSFFEKKKH